MMKLITIVHILLTAKIARFIQWRITKFIQMYADVCFKWSTAL